MRRYRESVIRRFPTIFAISCWIGAVHPVGAPMLLGWFVLTVAVLSRRRSVLVVAGMIATSIFGWHSLSGLQPLSDGAWSGEVEALADPVQLPGRRRLDVETSDGRMRLTIPNAIGSALRRSSAGSRFEVEGTIAPPPAPERVRGAHIRMEMQVDRLRPVDGRDSWRRPVDLVRGLILVGARSLPEEQRPVYTGFVIGDDRGSDPEVIATFQESGLSHLLVVSGQNVVFVMTVVGPLLQRVPGRARTVTALAILLFFAAVTRFEPSVLRATMMAMIAVVSVGMGRPKDAINRLSIAVALLLLIDPLLVSSIGFRLSVAATAGIACLADPIRRLLRGPRAIRQILAMTIAAQLSVAPLVIPIFGPMPLSSIPANLLAEPVAAFVMMWGSSVGLIAGLADGLLAGPLLVPVRLAVSWIMQVARVCASLPLPRMGLVEAASIVAMGLLIHVIRRVRRSVGRSHPIRGHAG